MTQISHLSSLSLAPSGLTQVVCTLVAALLHFFFLSSFCWVLTEAWQSYMAVTGRLRNRIIRKRFLCLGWGKSTWLSVSLPLFHHLCCIVFHARFFIFSEFNFRILFYLAGLPALVVAVSVGFTKAKGYGTVN